MSSIKKSSEEKSGSRNPLIYILYILGTIILITVAQIITIKITYKPLFDWWKQSGGGKYNKLINLFNVITAYKSRYLHSISTLVTPPVASLTLQQGQFLMGELFPYQTWVNSSTGEPLGALTPRSICESIKPAPAMYDPIFDEWYHKRAFINSEPQNYESRLVYDTVTTGSGSSAVEKGVVKPDPSTGKYGVYPSNKDFDSWRWLINEWLGNQWEWAERKDGASVFKVPVPKKGADINNALDKWYENKTGRGDNFLARMGINPDSPLIIYFVNGTYSVNGMVVDAVAFENLLSPSGPGAGGWVGYMKGMGDDKSFDDYKKYIRTRVDSQPIPIPPPCTEPKQKAAKGAMAFFASALPLIGFGISAALTGGATAIAAGLAIGVAGVGVGAISAVQATSSTC